MAKQVQQQVQTHIQNNRMASVSVTIPVYYHVITSVSHAPVMNVAHSVPCMLRSASVLRPLLAAFAAGAGSNL